MHVFFVCYHPLQRAKNPVSASALLTGKFLRIRTVFARLIYNSSLKGQHLSAKCKLYKGKMEGFKLFVSGKFWLFLDSKDTVWTVSILSGRFQYCPDSAILSGWFQYYPDSFMSQEVSNCIIYCRNRHSRSFLVHRERVLRAFFKCPRNVITRFVPKTFARKKPLSGKF